MDWWKLLIVLGFLASCVGAFIPMHDVAGAAEDVAEAITTGTDASGTANATESAFKGWFTTVLTGGGMPITESPVLGYAIILVGVIAAIVSGVIMYTGDGKNITSVSKWGIAIAAVVTYAIHLYAVFNPTRSDDVKLSNVNRFGWLTLALVVCGGIVAITFLKL